MGAHGALLRCSRGPLPRHPAHQGRPLPGVPSACSSAPSRTPPRSWSSPWPSSQRSSARRCSRRPRPAHRARAPTRWTSPRSPRRAHRTEVRVASARLWRACCGQPPGPSEPVQPWTPPMVRSNPGGTVAAPTQAPATPTCPRWSPRSSRAAWRRRVPTRARSARGRPRPSSWPSASRASTRRRWCSTAATSTPRTRTATATPRQASSSSSGPRPTSGSRAATPTPPTPG